jgi:hypothetical protein
MKALRRHRQSLHIVVDPKDSDAGLAETDEPEPGDIAMLPMPVANSGRATPAPRAS